MADQCQWSEPIDTVKYILNVSEEMNQLKDVDAMLDKILLEARNLANADSRHNIPGGRRTAQVQLRT